MARVSSLKGPRSCMKLPASGLDNGQSRAGRVIFESMELRVRDPATVSFSEAFARRHGAA